MKRLLFIFLFVPFFSTAQNHTEFWSKINATATVNKTWSIGMDIQYRRQADYKSGDKNIFHYPMATSIRAWLYYSLKNQWQIILSPIAYFKNDDILNSNGEIRQTKELRQMAGTSKSVEFTRIKNKNRFLIEVRFIDFDNNNSYTQFRYRLQNSFIIPLHKKEKATGINYFFSNEILIKNQKQQTNFDQNRVYNALQWKLMHADIDLGYQWVVQRNTTTTFHRNQFYVMLNLSI
jgi:Protein of unknown function (DUF2490)